MKKILLLMTLVLPFLLNSCGDDKDILSTQEQELLGEWALIKTADNPNDIHYVFKKERTGSRRRIEDGNVVSDFAFRWTFDGNKLTLDYGTGENLVMEVTIGINKLRLIYVATGAVEDYQRVVKPDEDD